MFSLSLASYLPGDGTSPRGVLVRMDLNQNARL